MIEPLDKTQADAFSSTESEMPADVIAEIEAGRKIAAIKLLRTQRGIGLKEAKELVDAYCVSHPSSVDSRIQESDSGVGRILLLALGVGVIFAIYRFFT